ncbi:MAG: response regulator [Nevskia sp.]|nr:response regulator [Nevskia sp.]
MTKPAPDPLLIVDDNEMNRDVLAQYLERRGYATMAVPDGPQALALIDRQPFGLVLLDVMMPGMTGLEVLKTVRARFGPSDLPVIMVTVKDESEDIVAALELGANDYVTKPLDFPVALARIRTHLQLKRSQQELRQATARLERSNNELKTFVSAVSHDLQEPLWKIKAAADLLQARYGESLPPEGAAGLARILQSAEWMQIMFDGLLSYAMVATKAGVFKPVALAKVLQQVLSDLEMRLEQTGGQVEAGELPTIEGDLLQLHQLLLNLVGNGLKFHRPGVPPRVRIEARLLPAIGAEPDRCELVVRDNGIGFDETQTRRIFNMFERLHDRDSFAGSGVGLAICRKIAERHGGTITATSAADQGATFTVTLPRRQPADEEPA